MKFEILDLELAARGDDLRRDKWVYNYRQEGDPMMPVTAHNRHSMRLPGYDYAEPGGYFVTIVTRGRELALGTVVDGESVLSNQGHAVQATWNQIPQHFPNVVLDAFVILPNHVHGIIMIMDDDRATPGGMGGFRRGEAFGNDVTCEPARNMPNASPLPHGTQPASLAAMIQNFKSVSTRRINTLQNTPGQPFWQRNYYEHVIRNEAELVRVRQYVRDNPLQWKLDEENRP